MLYVSDPCREIQNPHIPTSDVVVFLSCLTKCALNADKALLRLVRPGTAHRLAQSVPLCEFSSLAKVYSTATQASHSYLQPGFLQRTDPQPLPQPPPASGRTAAALTPKQSHIQYLHVRLHDVACRQGTAPFSQAAYSAQTILFLNILII